MGWPFLEVRQLDEGPTGWCVLNGPLVTEDQREEFSRLRWSGFRFAGMSSYLTFPALGNEDPLDYESACEAWCHCFRAPEAFLRTGMPRALISLSDFADPCQIAPPLGVRRGHYILYVGADSAWKKQAKNWSLAAGCLPMLSKELGLDALVIGASDAEFPESSGVSFLEQMPWQEFLALLAQASFLFVPNSSDPSPRILAEALCLDVPLLVHVDILGGWKYVNAYTGAFFSGRKDVVGAARKCLQAQVYPRNWFSANYGPVHSGRRLLHLLKRIDPSIKERAYVWLHERPAASDPSG